MSFAARLLGYNFYAGSLDGQEAIAHDPAIEKKVPKMARICNQPQNVELRVPCKPQYVRTVRVLVEELANLVPLSGAAIDEVKVAASEAVTNIVRHAYGDAGQAMPIVIRCNTDEDKLTIEIVDYGVGFTVPAANSEPKLDTSKEGGLGIILIRKLMDKVDYWSQPNLGTRIKMTKLAERRGSPAKIISALKLRTAKT
jgi:serine/threonine-protein kinase RsbW